MNQCNTITLIEKNCIDNIGGVKELYALAYWEIDTLTISDNKQELIDLTFLTDQFKPIYFSKGNCDYSVNESVNNKISTFKHTVNLKLNKRTKILNENLNNFLSSNGRVVLLLKLNNNNWVVLGLPNGMIMKSNSGGSGVNKIEGTSYNFVIEGDQPYYEFFITQQFVDDKLLIG